MNWSVVPPLVAGVVAVAISAARRIAPILVESSASVPSPRVLAMYVHGGRLVSFVLVYGVLFGLAYWVGRRRGDARGAGSTALASGAVAALGYLVGTGAILLAIGAQETPIVNAAAALGSGVGVGAQLAVVTFAGAVPGGRR